MLYEGGGGGGGGEIPITITCREDNEKSFEEAYVFSIMDEFYVEESECRDEEKPMPTDKEPPQVLPQTPMSTPASSESEFQSFTSSSSSVTDEFVSNQIEVKNLKTPPLPPIIPNTSKANKKKPQDNYVIENATDDDDDFNSVVFFNLDEEKVKSQKQCIDDRDAEDEENSNDDDEYIDTSNDGHREFLRNALMCHIRSTENGKVNRDSFFDATNKSLIFSLSKILFAEHDESKKFNLFGEWLDIAVMQRMKRLGDIANEHGKYTEACFFYICCNRIKEATAMALVSNSPYLATMIAPLNSKIDAAIFADSSYKEIDKMVLEVVNDGLAYLGFHFWTAMKSGAQPKELRGFLETFLNEHEDEFMKKTDPKEDDAYGGDEKALIYDFIVQYARNGNARFKSFMKERKTGCVILWILSTLMDKGTFGTLFGPTSTLKPSVECIKYFERTEEFFEWAFHVRNVEEVASAALAGGHAMEPDKRAERMSLLEQNAQFLTPEKEDFLVRYKLFELEDIVSLWENYEYNPADARLFALADPRKRDRAIMSLLQINLPGIILGDDRLAVEQSLNDLVKFLTEVKACEYSEAALAYFSLCGGISSSEVDNIPSMNGREVEMLSKLFLLLLEWHDNPLGANPEESIVLNLMITRFVEYVVSYTEENIENPDAHKLFGSLRKLPLSVSAKNIINSSLIK